MIGYHFEMGKVRRLFGEEEIEDAVGEGHIEIKGAVDEFETSSTALPKSLKLFEELIEGEITHFLIDRGEAELTLERTSP